jgi:hypothetical protein
LVPIKRKRKIAFENLKIGPVIISNA